MNIGDQVFCPRSAGGFTKATLKKIEGITAYVEWEERDHSFRGAIYRGVDGSVRMPMVVRSKWVALSKLRPVPASWIVRLEEELKGKDSDPYLEVVSP